MKKWLYLFVGLVLGMVAMFLALKAGWLDTWLTKRSKEGIAKRYQFTKATG